ncbi:hypothetical protein ASPTUDRAFT_187218 [Aspergillus tubingensis CBS 134.48]|uniref:AB hydrolase-1 domain-containing protein n=1 Tax=Aspergillus tubingensis (strain CBS 134.48) TaxID=767770 RepID=A0A1L9NQG9_ASPTC|nr:hypothetical protein ASPTUDRAFT_187218 [Aspergillus tubingensis CBS 134.48]
MRLFRNTIAVLAMMLTVHQMSAWAQNMSYGADNFYRSDIVTVTPITFQDLYRTTIQGNLFTRNNLSRSIESPAIIVGHPMSAVKEQSAKFYATKLAEQGFVTVSLDLPFWGASGVPRSIISARRASWIGSGLAFSLHKSQTLAQRKAIIAAAAQERWVEAEGGPTQYSGGVPSHLTANTSAVDREFYDFYFTRRGDNPKFMNFYPFNDIDSISPRPLLFISDDQAHSREFSENAYAQAKEPKELYWVPGAGHVDLYDRVELIPWDKLTQFFRANFR